MLEVLAGLAVLAGAALQAAVGFGFSLVCAPLVFAAFGPLEAVGLLTVLGLEVNLVSLLGEGRRPRPLPAVVPILLWSVPGMIAGVFILRGVDARTLQVALTVVVVLGLVARKTASSKGTRDAPGGVTVGVAGLLGGVLTTTTSTAGPPLVMLLSGRGHSPLRVRDTLTASFAGFSVLGGIVLAATGTHRAVPGAVALAALVPLAAAGQVLGRPLFHRLSTEHYDTALYATLALSAVVGLVAALV